MAAMAPVWVNSCCALAAAAALVSFRVSSEQPTSECQTPASHCRDGDSSSVLAVKTLDVHRLVKIVASSSLAADCCPAST